MHSTEVALRGYARAVDDFERYAEEAIASLPPDLRDFMSNVGVVVEDEPPAGLPLLGLYEGVPLTRRGGGVRRRAAGQDHDLPRAARARCCGDPERLQAQIRRVVLHEIAHHFGIGDERLRELDRY